MIGKGVLMLAALAAAAIGLVVSKKGAAATAGAGGAAPSPTPQPTPAVPGTTVSTTPGAVIPSSALPGANIVPPASVLAQIVTAVGSGDPATMRKVADSLEQQGWLSQAADLRAAADVLQKAQQQAQQQSQTTPTPTVVVTPPSSVPTPQTIPTTPLPIPQAVPMPTTQPDIDGTTWMLDLSQSITTGQATMYSPTGQTYQVSASQITIDAKGNRRVTVPGVGTVVNPSIKAGPVTVPSGNVPIPPIVVPQLPPPVVPQPPGVEAQHAALAGTLAGALTGATTATEPHALISQFQTQEGLTADGSYGSTVAWQLANIYNIVPPTPLHWGTKVGGYNSYVADKKAYAAKLQSKATTDTARADQWNKAAALALKGI